MTLRREDRDDGIVVLTIDRPEARNALSPEIRRRSEGPTTCGAARQTPPERIGPRPDATFPSDMEKDPG